VIGRCWFLNRPALLARCFTARSAATSSSEIRQALTGVHRVGVLENIFVWGGATVHEIVIVLSASFADASTYEIEEQTVRDSPCQTPVIWRALGATSPPLYPEGVADLASTAI
jgi:hypothetical protein